MILFVPVHARLIEDMEDQYSASVILPCGGFPPDAGKFIHSQPPSRETRIGVLDTISKGFVLVYSFCSNQYLFKFYCSRFHGFSPIKLLIIH